MLNEKLAFNEAVNSDPEFAWKLLEKLFARGERAKLRELVAEAPPSFVATATGPSRDSLLARLIKAGDLESLIALSDRSPDPAAFKAEQIKERFGNICETKDKPVVEFFLPKDAPTPVDHQQWTTAVLRRNMDVLERVSFNVQPKRATLFIESYFFDLQLAQLRYLETYIPEQQWPLRFSRDAIAREKGPGIVSFFIDHAFKNPQISQTDLWQTLAVSVKASHAKAFDKIVANMQARGTSFDWDQRGPTGDIIISTIQGNAEVRLSSNNLPEQLKECSLLELAVVKGDIQIAQSIMELANRPVEEERMALWCEAVRSQMKTARTKADKSNLTLAQMQSTHDLVLMQASADGKQNPRTEKVKLNA